MLEIRLEPVPDTRGANVPEKRLITGDHLLAVGAEHGGAGQAVDGRDSTTARDIPYAQMVTPARRGHEEPVVGTEGFSTAPVVADQIPFHQTQEAARFGVPHPHPAVAVRGHHPRSITAQGSRFQVPGGTEGVRERACADVPDPGRHGRTTRERTSAVRGECGNERGRRRSAYQATRPGLGEHGHQ